MDCPNCQNPMVTLELRDVEIDNCLSCGGIWLDKGELEFLIEDAEKAAQLLAGFQAAPLAKEKKRPCAICDRKMDKVHVGSEKAPLLIDRCPKHHGLWFDQGELDAILAEAALDPENKIRELLADMFGRK